MKDRNRTKEQLINEVEELRKRFAKFELAEKERKRVEEVAKESEQTLHSLLDSMNDLVFVIGSDGTFKSYYQPSHQEDLYAPPGEFLGKNFKDVLPPDVAESLQATISGLLTSGKTQQFEYRLEVKGVVKWWEARLSPITDSSGAITGFVAVSRETTERRRLEQTLNQRLRELNCLYGIGRVVETRNAGLDEICQETANLLSVACRYPEVACTRIIVDSKEFTTESWRDTPWKQSSNIKVHGKRAGIIEVCHLEERPEIDDGSFLSEERALIRAVAERLGKIIERKQVGENLKESEEKLRLMFDALPEGITVIDTEGKILQSNRATAHIYGYDNEREITGLNVLEFVNKKDRARVKEIMKKTLKKGSLGAIELTQLRKDQSEFRVQLNGTVLKDVSGNPIGFITIVEDITERKLAEKKLQEGEFRYRIVADNTYDWEWWLSPMGEFIYTSPSCSRITGYSASDFTDNAELFRSIIHHTDLPVWDKHKCASGQGEVVPAIKLRILRRDGSVRWIEHICQPVFNDTGEYLGSRGSNKDITERKLIEEALRQSEEKYRTILERMEDAYFETDLAGNITFANNSLCRDLGYSMKELVGKRINYKDYTADEDIKSVFRAFNEVYQTGVPNKGFAWTTIRKDGVQRFVETSISLLRNNEGEIIGFRGVGRDVTERKQAQEKLQASKASLAEAQRIAHVGNWDWDILKNEISYSDEFHRIFGRHVRNFEAFLDSLHPDDRQFAEKSVAKALHRNRTYDIEYRVISHKGAERVIHAQGKVHFDKTGKPARMVGTVQDITERKHAEQALIDEGMRWRTLMEQSRDGIVILDQDGHVYDCNQKFADMVGFPLESMYQLTVFDWEYLYPPERTLEMIQNIDKTGDHFETKHRRKDGSIYDAEISTNAAVFAGQKLVFCICRDITERKQIEEALRQSEQKLTVMFDSLPEGITVTDIDGKIVQLNSAAACMHGYHKQDGLIGKSAFVLISKEDHAKAADSLKRTLETGFSGILEYELVRKDGSTFSARLNASLMKDTSGKPAGFIAITTDITEEKKEEEAKQRAEQMAQVSSRLATVGQMASGVAHEINNPLTGVIGFANLLLRKDIPEAVRKDVETIRYNAQRVASIVQRLLIFARWQKPQRESVDINAIVGTTVVMRAYEMEANNIKTTMDLAPDLPEIAADGGQMQEVFLNIILNAETEMKLAHNKGNLLIKTERIDNTIRISFRDDGPGIPPENLERVFEPFFTTREVGQGTGLGLSISHGIIAEHGGQIYARSKLGKGATLIVELPIVNAAQVCEVVEPLTDEANNEITGRILVVDDEPVIRELLSEILADRGHEVETVDNATDALKKLESERYSLILLDIKMPGMNGIEFYQHIRDKAKSLARRIVFITGDAMGKETWHFLRQTKAPYLTKPFDEKKLEKVLSGILTSGR